MTSCHPFTLVFLPPCHLSLPSSFPSHLSRLAMSSCRFYLPSLTVGFYFEISLMETIHCKVSKLSPAHWHHTYQQTHNRTDVRRQSNNLKNIWPLCMSCRVQRLIKRAVSSPTLKMRAMPAIPKSSILQIKHTILSIAHDPYDSSGTERGKPTLQTKHWVSYVWILQGSTYQRPETQTRLILLKHTCTHTHTTLHAASIYIYQDIGMYGR